MKPPFDVEKLHSAIIGAIIDNELMVPYISKHITKDHYPVLIGGVNVTRCANLSERTRTLLGSLYANDIDIKYMIQGHVESLEDKRILAAHKNRMSFVNKFVKDKQVAKVLLDVAGMEPLCSSIELVIVDFFDSDIVALKENMRVCIKTVFKWGDGKEYFKDLIDTAVWSDYSQEMILSYQYFFDTPLKVNVPFHMHKGVPFATCGWTYFDTLRLLILCGEAYQKAIKSGDEKQVRFTFMKYWKYLAKFAVLYVHINKIKTQDPDYLILKRLYNKSQKIITGIRQRDQSTRVISGRQKTFMNKLVQELRGRTNMNRLEKLLKAGLPGKTFKS